MNEIRILRNGLGIAIKAHEAKLRIGMAVSVLRGRSVMYRMKISPGLDGPMVECRTPSGILVENVILGSGYRAQSYEVR